MNTLKKESPMPAGSGESPGVGRTGEDGAETERRLDFKELVDIPALQVLTDELYRATQIPSAIITMSGEILTGSGWQRICTDFHRKHPLIEPECIASDIRIRKQLDRGEPFVMYRCPRGLVDASSPVIIEGEHVANVFAGQLFTEPPNEQTERFFRRQARRFGLDEEAYMEAYREVPVFPADKFRPALAFLARFANLVATIGLSRKRELAAVEERARLRERLARAEKMEALGTLAGGVAHDLNNILGVLVGYAELLLMDLREKNILQEYAREILQGGQRAAAIIDDLLTLARRGVAVMETLNLNQIVSELLQSPEYAAMSAHHPYVRVAVELAPALLNMKGSRLHLRKALMNLLSNAMESIPGPGQVTISTDNLYQDRSERAGGAPREGEYVVLSVADTGCGINQDCLERIFEPFFSRKTVGRSGTGLGLAVVWGAVQDHGGTIDVRSAESEGSTFVLRFPASREQICGARESPPREEYLGRGERILVVDDREEQRVLAGRILEALGYRAEMAASGEEALRHVASTPVDLLVLDMILEPGMDGLDTFRRIRELRPDQRAVVVSGYSETERVREMRETYGCPYIRKPYLTETIGLAVRRELDRGDGSAADSLSTGDRPEADGPPGDVSTAAE